MPKKTVPLSVNQPETQLAIRKMVEQSDQQWLQMAQQTDKWSRTFKDRFEHLVNDFKLPFDGQDFEVLASHGWYVSPSMSCTLPRKLANELRVSNESNLDAAMCAYYEKEFTNLSQRLFESHPDRKQIISRAFEAHENQWYELSVPILLAQADGICCHLTGIGLYAKKDKDRQLKSYVENLRAQGRSTVMLRPLEIVLPLIAGQNHRQGISDELNRHAILHGESTNYATQTNSCKAMSLLNYVFEIISSVQQSDAAT